MEGYLPPLHAAAWTAAAAPFVGLAARRTLRLLRERPDCRLMLAAGTGFAFLLSALKLPSVAGSSSHPTGTGLGALLFGPAVMPLIGAIVLLFQALLLAHGGLTTLGANVFSMAVVGPWVAFAVWKLAGTAGLSEPAAIFLAAALGDLSTYLTTALQLALAFPDAAGGTGGAFLTFAGIFAVTQLPLAVIEGLLTASVFALLRRQFPAELAAFQKAGA